MSKLAKVLAEAKPARMGAPSKIELLDDEDQKAIAAQYVAGLSAGRIARLLTEAGFPITERPIVAYLRTCGVYRGG